MDWSLLLYALAITGIIIFVILCSLVIALAVLVIKEILEDRKKVKGEFSKYFNSEEAKR